jgi:hypothetical protein
MIALFGLSLALSISAAEFFWALFLLRWAWRYFQKAGQNPWRRSPLDLPLMLFYGWGLLTAWVMK